MSKKGDFLSGFSGGNTQKPLDEQNAISVIDDNSTDENTQIVKKDVPNKNNVAENKKLADKIIADADKKSKTATRPTTGTATRPTTTGTATRPAQRANAIIKAPEHVVTKDEKFHKRKMVRYGIIGVVAIVIAIIVFFLIRMLNSVQVPNFIGDDIREAEIFAITNNVTIEQEHEYNLEHAEGIIIEQDREPRSNMPRRSVLALTVSQGPNMDEIVALPDFEEMTGGQIRTWRSDYHMNAINIREENSSDVEAGQVIRIDVPSTVDIENFRRSDSLSIYISSGAETIQISNMVGNSREQVNEFIERNSMILVEIEYEAHETIPRGTVLRQSHAPNIRLEIGDTLTLTLSGGNPVVVPNFADMRRVDAEDAGGEDLNVVIQQRYHGLVPLGRFISQSVAAGEELFEDLATVTVVYSLGRPWIPIISMENQIVAELNEFIDRGAVGLTWNISHVDSYLERGAVVSQSIYNQFVALDAHINFQVSRGNLAPPPIPPAPHDGNEYGGNEYDGNE